MDDVQVGTSYPFAQMAKALATAHTHPDSATRERAEAKASKWREVVGGMVGKLIDVGSRTPVPGMPAWVTPEVVHGGFTTGRPVAGGPLQPHEIALAVRLGLLTEAPGVGPDAGLAVGVASDDAAPAAGQAAVGAASGNAGPAVGPAAVGVASDDAGPAAVGAASGNAGPAVGPAVGVASDDAVPVVGAAAVGVASDDAAAVVGLAADGAGRSGVVASGGGGAAGHVRAGLFGYHLTEAGLAELSALLDGGNYRVAVPEEAALLVAVWLMRAGDHGQAVELVETVAAWSDRLRFAPTPVDVADVEGDVVHRITAGDAREALVRRPADPRIEAQREALTVWNPFADELLSLWLETTVDGTVVDGRGGGGDWPERAGQALVRYGELAARYPWCGKHRKPRSNLFILRTCLEAVLAGETLEPRRLALLRRAVGGMVERRGAPGSPQHAALRGWQAAVVAGPTDHELGQAVAVRLAGLPADAGIAEPERLLEPVDGHEVPAAVTRIVERAADGTVEELVDRGVIGSAEVLATLTPQLTAGVVAGAYPDAALRRVMAANYRAFRGRRSLLLLNLQHQVRVTELPWVRAVQDRRVEGAERAAARATLARLAGLTARAFPATALPNPMIQELSTLSKAAGLTVPWTEELAADIFMGTFTPKFRTAALEAGVLLGDTLYARYYGVDYAEVARAADFGQLCRARAGQTDAWFRRPAANGTIIEQAQILTTHNLVTLIRTADAAGMSDDFGALVEAATSSAAGSVTSSRGASGQAASERASSGRASSGWPSSGQAASERASSGRASSGQADSGLAAAERWALRERVGSVLPHLELARRCFDTVQVLVGRLEGNRRPLSTIKDAAYAWRQMLVHLSLVSTQEQAAFAAEARATAPARLTPAVDGLIEVLRGGTARPFLGWTTERHWLLAG